MDTMRLELPADFDTSDQFVVGQFLAQLDDQSRLLKDALTSFEVDHLQWQPGPGVNTVGMLLAHVAIAETAWMQIIAGDLPISPEGEARVQAILGIKMEDDGLPLAADGGHPQTLSGWSRQAYFALLRKAREATYAVARTWQDKDLAVTHKTTKRVVSRHWILYHILEHFAAHFGQILMLKHMMQHEAVLES